MERTSIVFNGDVTSRSIKDQRTWSNEPRKDVDDIDDIRKDVTVAKGH